MGHVSALTFEFLTYKATSTVTPSSSLTHRVSANSNRDNIETFAAAGGGSVGILATFAAYLAISIYQRRSRSARQQQQDGECDVQSLRTDASDDTPSINGSTIYSEILPRNCPT